MQDRWDEQEKKTIVKMKTTANWLLFRVLVFNIRPIYKSILNAYIILFPKHSQLLHEIFACFFFCILFTWNT